MYDKNLLPFIITPVIFLYILISLGWKTYINPFFNSLILISIVSLLSFLHLFILFFLKKNLNKGYKSMIFLSFFILIISLIFSFFQIFCRNEKIEDIKIYLFISLILYILICTTYFMRIIVYVKIHNPAFIFITSFVLLSFLGSVLLMLPASTVKGISFVDALFTSTSAVCVTGLVVLDTAKDFTFLGKIILLVLVELGGLGILTITSFFSYFFRDGFSFREGIYISNFLNKKTTNNVLSLAVKVVMFTLIVEIIGTLLIYFSINRDKMKLENPLFFSIFHSVSAFCNSGFSTLSQGLYSEYVRFNYLLQFILACLLILGGIGFDILFNFFTYIWLTFKKFFYKIFKDEFFRYPAHIVTLNTKIVVFTTCFLLIIGTIFYYMSEYHCSLSEHPTFVGKWVVSFFSSATSRTAGFQVLDMKKLAKITILFTIFLMWIGASPASTGGGIKTSTFALALMNIISLSRGKARLEIQRKEISSESIKLAFSIIMLSIFVIYIGILTILCLDPKLDLLSISFEVFSAFSTAGLSLGITPHLCIGSKFVLIILMLLGRIGVFNIMLGLLKKNRMNAHDDYYRYPKGYILIS
ncbi:TrkH family potassium uptake protein [Blattabacterium cuenoti]|uniref:TrkH family potassium uptake protein n=1 Tax=Blattabacterium cuenoti TaxID=1653831 RepID=UPI00163C1E5F|nr:potassium transporter TrkG [Blattabacterium cuenoti]